MPKCILYLIFIFMCTTSYSQQPDCLKYREGKFKVADARAGGIIISERRAGYQTESMEVLKAEVRFKVNWINDCSYVLTLDKIIRNENKINFPNNLEIKVTILQTTDNGYTQEVNSSLYPNVYRCSVTLL